VGAVIDNGTLLVPDTLLLSVAAPTLTSPLIYMLIHNQSGLEAFDFRSSNSAYQALELNEAYSDRPAGLADGARTWEFQMTWPKAATLPSFMRIMDAFGNFTDLYFDRKVSTCSSSHSLDLFALAVTA
jgi:hypothetical protein